MTGGVGRVAGGVTGGAVAGGEKRAVWQRRSAGAEARIFLGACCGASKLAP